MVRACGIGAAIIIALAPAAARADVREGVEAWQRGDYKKAVETWRPLAIGGDADAQFNLAQAYKLGRGVPLDPGLAEQWFGKAAAQGHPQAEANFALALFQNGKRDEAVPWLEKAVARGEPRAQLVLGTMLFNGDSVTRDWVRAYALITRATAAGIPKAAETQAQMDQYIDTGLRQQGLALARQYESQQGGSPPPTELAGSGSGIRGAELPPSRVADGGPALRAQPSTGSATPANRHGPATSKPPSTKPAPVATAAPAPTPSAPITSGGWRVQLGAFRVEGNARSLWADLLRRAPALGRLQPVYVKAGALTRLQAGPIASNAEAIRICAAVKAAAPGTACLPAAR
ncbi:MAG: sporulation protein [Sphingomonas sp.]|nr:sporulation protein [Sphingomonas sp.]